MQSMNIKKKKKKMKQIVIVPSTSTPLSFFDFICALSEDARKRTNALTTTTTKTN